MLALVVAAACAVLTPQPVGATDPPAEPTAADKETARSLIFAANDKFAAGDFEGALKDYAAADAIMGVPTTGLGVGRALVELGRLVEARDVLLRVARSPAEPSEVSAFTEARAEATRVADTLIARIPSVQLVIGGVAAGTRVDLVIDGVAVPSAAAQIPHKLDPGTHTVTAGAPGFVAHTETVELREGDTRVVTMTLEAKPAPPQPPPVAPRAPARAVPTEPPPERPI